MLNKQWCVQWQAKYKWGTRTNLQLRSPDGKKVVHTRLPSVRFRSWSRFLAVSLHVTWIINPAVGCHYFPPGPQLPSQHLRGLLPISFLGKQKHDGCEQFAQDCYPTASRLLYWTRALLRMSPACYRDTSPEVALLYLHVFLIAQNRSTYDGLTFYIDGKEIAVVKKYLHLSHIISAQLDDKDDILAKRNSFCGKINSVLCYFRSCDPLVKVKLLRHYCCDYYLSLIHIWRCRRSYACRSRWSPYH